MRQQAKQYYYIDRKLVSSEQSEVIEGLRELTPFICRLEETDILNSVVMRLMDLYSTSKLAYTKILASELLVKCREGLSELPSRDEVVSILHKCLKSQDPLVRILTIQTITLIPSLFLRENSVYHLLFSRLRPDLDTSEKQTFCVISCLSALLSRSDYLSKLLSNNLLPLIELGEVPLKFILFLCCQAKFETQAYPKILNELWLVIKRSQTPKNKFYFNKLLRKAAYHNFICFVFLEDNFPAIRERISPLVILKYGFFTKVSCEIVPGLKDEDLLDLAYLSRDKRNLALGAACEKECEKRVQQALSQQDVRFNHLLMTFYCSKNFETQMLECCGAKDVKWIKASLVTGNFQLAYTLIKKHFMVSMENYCALSFLGFYCIARLDLGTEKMNQLMGMMRDYAMLFKSKSFYDLQACWCEQYGLAAGEPDQVIQEPRKSLLQKNQQSYEFEEEREYLSSGKRFAPSRMREAEFSGIYFSKRGVNRVFSLLSDVIQ